MIRDITDLSTSESLQYDVVVIGAGAAGITLALELMGSGLRVAVLEGGQRKSTKKSQGRYKGELTLGPLQDYPELDQWRLRFLGGTTGHWRGYCRPLDKNAFLPRPGISDSAWPWPRTTLDADYVRAHEICELGEPEYDHALLCKRAGVPVPFENTDVLAAKVWRFSPPTRFGTRYADDLQQGSVDVLLGANCVGFETKGNQIEYVSAVTDNKEPYRFRAKQFVLACGGIENVRQLLLLAKSGVSELNRSEMLGVGFAEHPHFKPGLTIVPSSFTAEDGQLAAVTDRPNDSGGARFQVGFGLQDDVLAANNLHNMSFTLGKVESNEKAPALTAGVRSLWSAAESGKYTLLKFTARTEQRFNSESRIRLTGEKDDLGVPRAGLDWRITEADRDDALTALRLVGGELMKQGFGPVYAGAIPGLETISGGAHHMGGARMHESADLGVVDPDLRCHALSNLYVASAATFPTTCFSNPTLTIVALAVRLARTLKERA